ISMRERIIELVHDLVVHRAAELRMRVEHDRDRRILLPSRMIPALDPSCGARENDLWHENLDDRRRSPTLDANAARRLRAAGRLNFWAALYFDGAGSRLARRLATRRPLLA